MAVAARIYSAAILSDDERTLTLVTANRRVSAPKTQPDQVGFTRPRISQDHHLVGWLTLVPNCCTSYPIPSTLVILRNGRIIRRFREDLPIFRWTFSDDGTAVAYQMSTVHGCSAVGYK